MVLPSSMEIFRSQIRLCLSAAGQPESPEFLEAFHGLKDTFQKWNDELSRAPSTLPETNPKFRFHSKLQQAIYLIGRSAPKPQQAAFLIYHLRCLGLMPHGFDESSLGSFVSSFADSLSPLDKQVLGALSVHEDSARPPSAPVIRVVPVRGGSTPMDVIDIPEFDPNAPIPDSDDSPDLMLPGNVMSAAAQYQIMRFLTDGGVGDVHLVADKNTGITYAVKILKRHEDDPELEQKLRKAHEKEVAHHRYLDPEYHARAIFTGTNASGDPFLVMELLEGGTLSDRLEKLRQELFDCLPDLAQSKKFQESLLRLRQKLEVNSAESITVSPAGRQHSQLLPKLVACTPELEAGETFNDKLMEFGSLHDDLEDLHLHLQEFLTPSVDTSLRTEMEDLKIGLENLQQKLEDLRNLYANRLPELLDVAIRLSYAVSKLHEPQDEIDHKGSKTGRSLRLVHRDLKPENVVFHKNGNLKLIDFGIIGEPSTSPREVEEGITVGYAQPHDVDDERQDIHALGVILFQVFSVNQWPLKISNSQDILLKQLEAKARGVPHGLFKPLATILKRLNVPQYLIDIIETATGSKGKTEKTYKNATDLYRALALGRIEHFEEEARRCKEKDDPDGWALKINDALTLCESLYEKYDSPVLAEKRQALHLSLFKDSEQRGHWREMRDRGRKIVALYPNSPAASYVQRPISADLRFDGDEKLLREARLKVCYYYNDKGVWKEDPKKTRSYPYGEFPKKIEADRLGGKQAGYKIILYGENIEPVARWLPFRPAYTDMSSPRNHDLRFPLYPQRSIPGNAVIVAAGFAAAKRAFSPSAVHFPGEDWRKVDHDFAVLPLQDNQSYYDYLQWLREKVGDAAAKQAVPKHWGFDPFAVRSLSGSLSLKYKDGRSFHKGEPIVGLSDKYVQSLKNSKGEDVSFRAYVSEKLGVKVDLPSLNEYKLAIRVYQADWPWGDKSGQGSVAFQDMTGAHASNGLLPVSDQPATQDVLPYSIDIPELKRPIFHAVSNVAIFIKPTPTERDLIAKRWNIVNAARIGTEIFPIAGISWKAHEKLVDGLDRIEGADESKDDAGVRFVIYLSKAQPTPALETLAA